MVIAAVVLARVPDPEGAERMDCRNPVAGVHESRRRSLGDVISGPMRHPHSPAEGGETLMTAVAVELLTRPPELAGVAEAGTLPTLAPDAVEFVADTDTLITMCACSASSDQPY